MAATSEMADKSKTEAKESNHDRVQCSKRSYRGPLSPRRRPPAGKGPVDTGVVMARPLNARLFIECRACAYEPPQQDTPPRGRCPKCGATVWQRVWQPGRPFASME
jgi:hypothetical protein